MPDRRDVAGWLPGSGPRPPGNSSAANGADAGASATHGAGTAEPPRASYPGKDLGRPIQGPGSIGGVGRRFLSIVIDWAICLLIANAILGQAALRPPGSLWVNVIFGLENLLLVGTAGGTLGQRMAGLRVETVGGAHPGLARAAIRAVILALGFPALTLLWQQDQRGLHELASGTVTARR